MVESPHKIVATEQNFAQAVHSAFAGLDTPLIQQVAVFCKDQEKAILELPAAQQVDEQGRKFAPRSEYLKLKPEARATRWTLDADIVTTLATNINVHYAQEQAKTELPRLT